MSKRVLPAAFYARSPEAVARDLLGKRLIRVLDGDRLGGIVTETEAYYGLDDPASRAYRGKKRYNSPMWDEPGRLFVYNVHKYWMLNVIAHEPSGVGGVLFRAIEPTTGVRMMRRLRPVADDRELTSGPGKLSLAVGVTRELNGYFATDPDSPVIILDAPCVTEYCTSHRIGVTRDLPEELRFYIPGNRFVSRG
ncbi:MAG: DNA-3-methyladenine glycosylase [Candidatus Bathyarchaeota archaeon]|nr:DNA-3-methyladenine glycosylase [Candidatus Bathyarchaeota archaeon]